MKNDFGIRSFLSSQKSSLSKCILLLLDLVTLLRLMVVRVTLLRLLLALVTLRLLPVALVTPLLLPVVPAILLPPVSSVSVIP